MGGELKVISFKLSVLSSGQAENLELKTDNLQQREGWGTG
jgi:hypothetical protein